MSLAVVSYPKFIPNAAEVIPVMRTKYPKFIYPKLAPHFTFVFPQASVPPADLIHHVQAIAVNQAVIPFAIHHIQLVPEDGSRYIFLVPSDGFDGVQQLHDRLYTGVLAAELRLDIPFIPHITLGQAPNSLWDKKIAYALRAQSINLQGVIEVLDVVEVEGDTARPLAQIKLAG